ncbi:EAL domain-containing protein [Halobacillus litoralis]|uniref:EAL domain-containing protein n=1 Tax=Halobacillus litoralis TaxID=45668 RepID=A0A845FAS4_9BACI|nr:EAL domain-containing protein [Halobacillus litoralis]
MKVIAEGVETAEQWDFLKNEKCDEIQGYFYSKPLPPEQLITIFENKTIH